jgi:hypothetical protein
MDFVEALRKSIPILPGLVREDLVFIKTFHVKRKFWGGASVIFFSREMLGKH